MPDIAYYLERGMAYKDAYRRVEEDVFGVGFKRDRTGKPRERGVGSVIQPTAQSVAAFEKYCRNEPGYDDHLKKMKADLAEYQAKKAQEKALEHASDDAA